MRSPWTVQLFFSVAIAVALAGSGCSKSGFAVGHDGATSPDAPASDMVIVGGSGGSGGSQGSGGSDGAAPTKTPLLTVAPASITFAPTAVGNISAASTVTVTVTNGPASITPTVTGKFIIDSTTCSTAVAATCTISVKFGPSSVGAESGLLTIRAGLTVSLSGVGTGGSSLTSMTITPNPGSFTAEVGETSAPTTFSLTNSGGTATGALTVAPLSGPNADEFRITQSNCIIPLAPLSVCAITVTFGPTAAGTRTATLTVTDATAGSTPVTATLSGTATAAPSPSVLAITGSADLGPVTVGSRGTPSTYTVTNSGGTATGILEIKSGQAAFVIGSDLCTGLTLAAGQACTFTVTFGPTAVGVISSLLTANSAGALLAAFQVAGTGLKGPELAISPPTLDFGTIRVGTVSGSKTFTVTNNGATASGALVVVKNDTTSSVGGGSQFTYTTTCKATLAPAASCLVVVTYAPAIGGSAAATITVSDGTVSSSAATVAGIALAGTPDFCRGADFDFGSVVVGETSAPVVCTLTNYPGSSQATGAFTVATTGEFAVATNNCTAALLPTGLAPGQSCTIGLTFSPRVKGPRIGSMTLSAPNAGASNENLSGTGLGVVEIVEYANCALPGDAVLPLCPPQVQPFDFGQTTVGTNSDSTLTLAVFVRASVGKLSVTTALGTPEEFAIVSNGCSTYASSAPPAPFSTTLPLCLIYVQHKPAGRTVANGTVTVAGANGDSDSATMKGTGRGPLVISPSLATFSNITIGTASATVTLTVKNTGTVDINGASFTLTGANASQFSVVTDNLTGKTIPAGGSATIGVRFGPTSTGAMSAAITVTAVRGDSLSYETATVSLIANAVAP